MKKGEIAERLVQYLSDKGESLWVEEIRIGLGYVGVRLEGNRMGLAAVLRNELSPGCTLLDQAGHLTEQKPSTLLDWLVLGRHPLEKAIGLATANALISHGLTGQEKDSLELINLIPQDHVAMIGLFSPLVPRIKKSGATVSIIERDASLTDVPKPEERKEILKKCTVAIITATSLLNDTLEEILNELGNPRHVLILGPSTPLCPEIFQGTLVNHLGGSAIMDAQKVMRIISEGGGTPILRPYLRFVNILI